MGQKHNRRRTRQRPRNRSNDVTKPFSQFMADSIALQHTHPYGGYRTISYPPNSALACDSKLAPTWQYRYMTSQASGRRQYSYNARPESEQCRLFGGEPGDDVDLCYLMLEYFGKLDYIDT